jgi:hypothetical protein
VAVQLVSAPGFAPDLLYASNGHVVMRSRDAGCTWTVVYRALAAVPDGVPEITALFAPSSANSSDYLYVGVTTTSTGGLRVPSVAVSTRQGNPGSWTTADLKSPLPPGGTLTELAASAQLPTTAYAVVTVKASAAQRSDIYATSDAGVTWASRTVTTGFAGSGLVAHPSRQVELFARDASRVVRSTDGGGSFTLATPSVPITTFSAASGGGGVRLVAARADSAGYVRSDVRGLLWSTRATPSPVSDVAMAPLQEVVGFSTGVDFYLDSPRTGQVRRSPEGGAPTTLSVSAPTRDGFVVTGTRLGSVLQLAVGLDLRPRLPVPGPGGVVIPVRIHAASGKQFASLLAPPELTVSLPAGGRRVVPYRLLIPRTPTPLDAMFLVDTTGSMGGTINGLRKDLAAIVTALDAAGLDARFGLGDFQDYPYGQGNTDHAYQLDRRIGPADASLTRALNDLTLGGGGDGPESVLTALLQSTTGQGDFSVRPGQQAHYRPPALKLAFTATDNPFHEHGDANWQMDSQGRSIPWPGPTWAATMAALRKEGVHQVGLAVDRAAIHDMAKAATDTSTFAPAGGVDCNGDGVAEVAAASPLVCDISQLVSSPVGVGVGGPDPGPGDGSNPSAVGVTAAVVSLANGIPDWQAVRLRVATGQPYARIVTGAPSRMLNLKADNDLDYELELRCPVAPASRQHIALAAATTTRNLARADVTLECGGPSGRPVPQLPGPDAPALVAAPAAHAALAQPVPNSNPPLNINPNLQPNLTMNSGVVQQSQEEAQLALAVGETEALPASDELAMSAVRPSADRDLTFVAAAGLLLAGAAAAAARTRARACTSPAD